MSDQDQIIYRHQFCAFLTRDQQQSYQISIIKLPSYEYLFQNPKIWEKDISLVEQSSFLKFHLPYGVDQKLLKAQICQIGELQGVSGSTNKVLLILQFLDEIIIKDIEKQEPLEIIKTGRSVNEMIIQQVDKKKQKLAILQIFAVVKKSDENLSLCIITINEIGVVFFKVLMELKMSKVLNFEYVNNQILILDEHLTIQKYRFIQKTQTIKLIEELKLLERAKDLINKGIKPILTEAGAYLGNQFYLAIKKSNNKDNEFDFEQIRQKDIHNIREENLLSNPFQSVDKQSFIYLMCSSSSLFDNFADDFDLQDKRKSQIKKPVLFNAIANQLRQMLLQYQPVFCHAIVNPLLQNSYQNILHKDAFTKTQISFTTFTPYNDIMLMTKKQNQIMIFDVYGKPLEIIIRPSEVQQFKNLQIELLQIKKQAFGILTLLFQDLKTFYIYQLKKEKEIYQFFLNKTISKIQEDDEDDSLFMIHPRLDIHGNLYQMIISKDQKAQNKLKASVYINININESISETLTNLMKNFDNKESNKMKYYLLKSKNKTLKNGSMKTQRLIDQDTRGFGFEIIHDKYFVFKQENELFFQQIKLLKQGHTFNRIKVELRHGYIAQIAQTQNEDLVQFVYLQFKPSMIFFIITWNLANNTEQQLLKLPFSQERPQMVKLAKGVNELMNYYFPKYDEHIYDIRFEYPCNLFSGRELNADQNQQSKDNFRIKHNQLQKFLEKMYNEQIYSRDELKVSMNFSQILGVSKYEATTLFRGYSYLNLCYQEYLVQFFNETKLHEEEEHLKVPILKLMKFQEQSSGQNVMHYFYQNENFLKQFIKEILHQQMELESKDIINFCNYVLFPNHSNHSALSLAIQHASPKCIDLLLDILCMNPTCDYFGHLKSHFFHLLKLKSRSFETFLEQCNQISMKKRIKWKFGRRVEAVFFTTNTQYISDSVVEEKMLIRHGKANRHIKEDQKQDQPAISAAFPVDLQTTELKALNDPLSYQTEPTRFNTQSEDFLNLRSVVFTTYDFGWLLRGMVSQQLIDYLDQQPNDSNVFLLKSIQTIVDSQWRAFTTYYKRRLLIPFGFYYLMIMLFSFYRNPKLYSLEELHALTYSQTQAHRRLHYLFGLGMVLLAAYFILIETLKLRRTVSGLAVFQLVFHCLVVISFVVDYNDYGDTYSDEATVLIDCFYLINSMIVTLVYFLMLMHMRIFEQAAILINLIFYVMKQSMTFQVIFVIMNFAFGNSLFIMSMLEEPEHIKDKLAGPDIFISFVMIYRGVMGDSYTDELAEITNYNFIFQVFSICTTMLMNVVLLNLLVAILSDIYSQVTRVQESERYKAKCKLIYENEFIIPREQLFKDAKYIVRVETERSAEATADSYDVQNHIINTLNNSIKRKIDQEQTKVRNELKTLRSKLGQLGDAQIQQDQQLQDTKSLIMLLKHQNDLIMSKLSKIDQNQNKLIISNAGGEHRLSVVTESQGDDEERHTGGGSKQTFNLPMRQTGNFKTTPAK